MSRIRVAYYAHHLGAGHLRNAQKLAAMPGLEVQVASTGKRNTSLLPGPLQYVSLPADNSAGQPRGKMRSGDDLHYAPVGPLIRERFATLNQAWHRFSPDVVMVDVSTEVALFARLSGYPVALRRMPGTREDSAHELGYRVSDALFAYYPAAFESRAHQEMFGYKSHHLGMLEPQRVSVSPRKLRSQSVVVQTSLASSIALQDLVAAASASPAWHWDVVGSVGGNANMVLPSNLHLRGVVPNPGMIMADASLIISSAGHNAVAAAAAARRPTLLVPEERPHDEQREFAKQLETAGIPMAQSWTTPVHWPSLLTHAAGMAPDALAQALFVSREEFADALHTMINSCVETAQA